MRMCIISNHKKSNFASELYQLILNYRLGTTDEREKAITSIEIFMQKHQSYLHNSTEDALLKMLINQSTTITKKAPEKLIDIIENACLKMVDEANEQCNPFSNVCLISSFSLSSLLTILIAFIAL